MDQILGNEMDVLINSTHMMLELFILTTPFVSLPKTDQTHGNKVDVLTPSATLCLFESFELYRREYYRGEERFRL